MSVIKDELVIVPKKLDKSAFKICEFCGHGCPEPCDFKYMVKDCPNVIVANEYKDEIVRLNLILKMCDKEMYVLVDKSYTGRHFALFKGKPELRATRRPLARYEFIETMKEAVQDQIWDVNPDFVV